MKPVPWLEIPGGMEQLEEAVDAIADKAAQLQARFSQALDILGEPGELEWDPNKGFIRMRGHKFSAQITTERSSTFVADSSGGATETRHRGEVEAVSCVPAG